MVRAAVSPSLVGVVMAMVVATVMLPLMLVWPGAGAGASAATLVSLPAHVVTAIGTSCVVMVVAMMFLRP